MLFWIGVRRLLLTDWAQLKNILMNFDSGIICYSMCYVETSVMLLDICTSSKYIDFFFLNPVCVFPYNLYHRLRVQHQYSSKHWITEGQFWQHVRLPPHRAESGPHPPPTPPQHSPPGWGGQQPDCWLRPGLRHRLRGWGWGRGLQYPPPERMVESESAHRE